MVEYGTYKGNRTVTLKRSATDKYGFTFGEGKAQLIAENNAEVLAFAAGTEKRAPAQDITDRQYEDDCQRRTGA